MRAVFGQHLLDRVRVYPRLAVAQKEWARSATVQVSANPVPGFCRQGYDPFFVPFAQDAR